MAKSRLRARNEPQQERSKKTRSEILEATARLLNKMDEANVTTNHIAKVTGISIGTLYKHYPNKDAILSDLIDLYLEKDFQEFQDKMSESKSSSVIELTDRLLDWIIETHRAEHTLRSTLYSNLGRLQKNKRAFAVRQEIAGKLFASPLKEIVENPRRVLLMTAAINAMIHTLSQVGGTEEDWASLRTMGRKMFVS